MVCVRGSTLLARIQGGDPTGTGAGGEGAFEKKFKDEFHVNNISRVCFVFVSKIRFIRSICCFVINAGCS